MITVISFICFLAVFVLIGVLSVIANKHTSRDYLLASSNIKPWLVALSAIATNNSGYMFIGMIGFTYSYGLSSIWLMVGWIVGDFIMSFLVHKQLRETTGRTHTRSYGGILAKWNDTEFTRLRGLVGLITVVFLGTYAAAQLSAGSKALYVLFDWPYETGAIVGAVMVVAYCVAGGIRASIWTDAAQSFVMLFAMALMLYISYQTVGGWSALTTQLNQVSDTYMNWFPPDLDLGAPVGPFLFVLGWLFAGFAIVGQPHIMVRFMTMDSPRHMTRARAYYYAWYFIFYAMTIGAGLSARLLLPESATFDAELALPTLARDLLPPVLVGLVLAGMFAATMSTADSLIISCTAAITRDFGIKWLTGYWTTKLITILITAFALVVALYGPDSVFVLVVLAWGAMGSTFGPILMVYALGQRPNEWLTIAMALGGLGTMLVWRELGWDDTIYEAAPGIMAGLAIFGVGKLFDLLVPDTTIVDSPKELPESPATQAREHGEN